MTRSFQRVGYDRGTYNVRLIEDGHVSLKRFSAHSTFRGSFADNGEAYAAHCKKVRRARDQWLRAWMREKTMA